MTGGYAVRRFSLDATNGAGQHVSKFAKAYTLEVSYDPAALGLRPDAEAALTLAYWNGSRWEQIPAAVDPGSHRVTAQLDHFTEFALVAAGSGLFLPLIRR